MDVDLTMEQENALCEPYFATPPPDDHLLHLLKTVFKLDNFRLSQLDVIRSVISGRDCFVRMATGSGKSLLWQLPALVQPNRYHNSLTVVICPTKSLIMDQMTKLCKLAPPIEPVCYHRDQPPELNDDVLRLMLYHDLLPHVLLITPEVLLPGGLMRKRLEDIHKNGRLARFVIDEADKFLAWGESFRRAYLELKKLRSSFSNIPILAISGSLTNDALEDSINELGMQQCVRISESLNRPNLSYEIKPKNKPRGIVISDILSLVSEGPGIVYCTLRKETEEIAGQLRHKGIRARTYHAKLTRNERKETLDSWRANVIQVVVATTAFGMGVDKSNVRWVVHDTMPSSVEGWFQESGRAGRDGHQAKSIIYFQIQDYRKVKEVIANLASADNLATYLKPLHQLTRIILNPVSCRRKQLLAYFNEAYPQENCAACDNCLHGWKTAWSLQDVTVDALNALELLYSMCQISDHPHWTERNLAMAIRGEKDPDFTRHSVTALKGYGCQFAQACGKNATRSEIMEFLLVLIHSGVITEYKLNRSNPGYASGLYITPGPRASEVADRTFTIEIPIRRPAHPGDLRIVQEVDQSTGRIIDVYVIDD